MSIQQLHAQVAMSAPPTPAEIEQFVHEMGVLAAAHRTPEQQVQFALNGFMVGRVAKALEAMLASGGKGWGQEWPAAGEAGEAGEPAPTPVPAEPLLSPTSTAQPTNLPLAFGAETESIGCSRYYRAEGTR